MGGRGPNIFSIAAHRGFADALVAGLAPRYDEAEFGLARLTLLLPSARAARTLTEAFIRHAGDNGQGAGLLLPRMATVADLDLDEALGSLLDPLAAGTDIPPAADPTYRWLRLAALIADEPEGKQMSQPTRLRIAFELAQTMDRLLAEEIAPAHLLSEAVMETLGTIAGHWQNNLRLFATVQARWQFELDERGEVDAATRRNMLFDRAAKLWRETPPDVPIVAAGITGVAPALARLLRTIADMPQGAVVLPDLDLNLSQEAWDELGSAGAPDAEHPLGRDDAVTHPQYHLKLLLNRMGISREDVQLWHRSGVGAGPSERSHAISSLFLPPQASQSWAQLPANKRRLTGVRLMESANPEEEAQAIALLVREVLATPERRVAVVSPDRGLAARVVQHLRRWNVEADDTAGQPLSQTPAGRLFLLLTEVVAERAAPVPLMALLEHPLIRPDLAETDPTEEGENIGPMDRAEWLRKARAFELGLRGPRQMPGFAALNPIAAEAHAEAWWHALSKKFDALMLLGDTKVEELLARFSALGEALCGEDLWAREDGRALAQFVETLRTQAHAAETLLHPTDVPAVLREAMDRVAVRPPYGGHPRVAIYGLLESRMTRADVVICAGLNEGTWPASPKTDALLAPAVMRALGVPGGDFRIGLSAHDLAGALGAAEVVLSRAQRDVSGPANASRFWLRVKALLGARLAQEHQDDSAVLLARSLDAHTKLAPHPRPQPRPSADQRRVPLSVTSLDRLRSDPYQFYASSILRLRELDGLDAEPTPAWQGTLVHGILEEWHKHGGDLLAIAEQRLQDMNAHPLTRALWRPRLMKSLQWVQLQLAAMDDRKPVAFEKDGVMEVQGIRIFGKIDRLDRSADGSLAIVDYKTGHPPSGKMVEAGYSMQLGTLGLLAESGAFGVTGKATKFEYWSLAKPGKGKPSETGFGYVETPLRVGSKRSGPLPDEFLPKAKDYLNSALDQWILGDAPFTARLNPDADVYNTFDQVMRLDEWLGGEA